MPREQFCANAAIPKQDGVVIKHKNCILWSENTAGQASLC